MVIPNGDKYGERFQHWCPTLAQGDDKVQKPKQHENANRTQRWNKPGWMQSMLIRGTQKKQKTWPTMTAVWWRRRCNLESCWTKHWAASGLVLPQLLGNATVSKARTRCGRLTPEFGNVPVPLWLLEMECSVVDASCSESTTSRDASTKTTFFLIASSVPSNRGATAD